MACFLVIHQTQSSVGRSFILVLLCCPANMLVALPPAESLCTTNSIIQINTQSLLDDDLPPVSEAFALPPHIASRSSAIATTPHIPRVTLRATTNDGKTFYLRKRKKAIPSEMAVSQLCIEGSHNRLTYKDMFRLHQLKGSEICLEFLFIGLWMGCQLPPQKICNARMYHVSINSQPAIKMTFQWPESSNPNVQHRCSWRHPLGRQVPAPEIHWPHRQWKGSTRCDGLGKTMGLVCLRKIQGQKAH